MGVTSHARSTREAGSDGASPEASPSYLRRGPKPLGYGPVGPQRTTLNRYETPG
jgi:hypothetical protein